jgi:hypothetical protein
MSDLQIALLILGLTIVLFMIIYNWIQLKNTRKQQERADSIKRKQDPLFTRANNLDDILDDYLVHEPTNEKSSIDFLKKNLPHEINLKFESVVSLTSSKTYKAKLLIDIGLVDYLKKLRLGLYLRKENDIWATGDALNEDFSFDQLILSLPLISRRLEVNKPINDTFIEFIEKIKEHIEVNQIWLSNEDPIAAHENFRNFKNLINKSILIKVQPKTDSSFHFGAFQDFFNKSNIRIYKEFHWYYDAKVDGAKMFKIMNLSSQPLKIENDAFIQGLIIGLDIPTTLNLQKSFNEMMNFINEFCIKLNAVMVDANSKEIDSIYIASIKDHIDRIAYEMKKNNIEPGSEQAIKYFS